MHPPRTVKASKARNGTGHGQGRYRLRAGVSRPAQNSTDWDRLLEICAVSNKLILDEGGIYFRRFFDRPIAEEARPQNLKQDGLIHVSSRTSDRVRGLINARPEAFLSGRFRMFIFA